MHSGWAQRDTGEERQRVREVRRQENKGDQGQGQIEEEEGKERIRRGGREGRDLGERVNTKHSPQETQRSMQRLKPYIFIILLQKLHPNHSLIFYS